MKVLSPAPVRDRIRHTLRFVSNVYLTHRALRSVKGDRRPSTLKRRREQRGMKTVAGIFNARADAERAVERLRALGVAEANISLLTPGTTPEELDARVPTTETEQP